MKTTIGLPIFATTIEVYMNKFEINSNYGLQKEVILNLIDSFDTSGKTFGDANRNHIKVFDVNGKSINIKSFKKPSLVNKIAYRFLRKSKAQRSFEYANRLLKVGIGTPTPIAYFENYDAIGLKESYYISEHIDANLTYRELVREPNYPDHENILQQFTAFSFNLHEKGIEFKDHSPGNTLIVKTTDKTYRFYLVDLNRMEFHNNMPFDLRMKNLSRLTPKKEMVAQMSKTYATLSNEPYEKVFQRLWRYTQRFQKRFHKRRNLKKKLKLK